MSDSSNNSLNTSVKKKSLGRGLGSLLGADLNPTVAHEQPAVTQQVPVTLSKGVNTQTNPVSTQPQAHKIPEESQIWKIQIDRLQPNTQQPRQIFDQPALQELAASIKEKGILQPITARRLDEKSFEIIAGERRWRAAQLAGLHEVPVILKKVTLQDSLEYAIIENIQRENLNPLEEAEAYEHLMREYSLTQQQVAEKVGKERATVANSLRLLTLPPEVRIMLQKSELSAGHAKVLLSIENPREQVSIAKQILKEKLSVRAVEKIAAKLKSGGSLEKSSSGAINLDVSKRLVDGLSSELQRLLGTKVTIDYAASKGKISVYFYSDEELTNFVEKIRTAWQK